LASLAAHNIKPTLFDWPYGAMARPLLKPLTARYRLLRGCCNPNEVAKGNFKDALYHFEGERMINAMCIDIGYSDTTQIRAAMVEAKRTQSALYLYGHELVDQPLKGKTLKATLIQLAKWRKSIGLASLANVG
jgi:hypothetical protein